ncbi:MAG: ATP-binding protein [Actinomycetota bacterium]
MLLALTVPLALSLRDRARSEQETQALTSALTIAAILDRDSLKEGPVLDRLVKRFAAQIEEGRVIATDSKGVVLADSDGTAKGENFNTSGRPEIQEALGFGGLRPRPNADIRPSKTVGADILVAAAPVLDPGLIGAVRVRQDIQSVNAAVRRTTFSLIAVIGGIGLSIGLVIAVIMSGSLARPLTRLAATARRLGAGDLSARAHDLRGADEIEELAGSFDEMADRVERTVQAQREFVANASHQLRTPLTGMKLRLESAIERADTPEMTHDLTAADREIDRLAATVDRLLVMARTLEEGGSTEIELHDAAERAADRWRERAATRGSTVSVDGDPVTSQANATDVDQILDNLLENAMTYAPGSIQLETGIAERRAFVSVRDHGPGIPSEEQGKVTERFYRGKTAPPGGSGLGLAIARNLAERWGGALSVQGAEGGGTRIEVRFRVASTPSTSGMSDAEEAR